MLARRWTVGLLRQRSVLLTKSTIPRIPISRSLSNRTENNPPYRKQLVEAEVEEIDLDAPRELREEEIVYVDEYIEDEDVDSNEKPLVNAFAHTPQPPELEEVLKSALSRSNKHKILASWFTLPPADQSIAHKHGYARTSRKSVAAKHTYKLKTAAKDQLSVIGHTLLDRTLSRFLNSLPRLSRLHPFDRALVRLSLPGGEQEYSDMVRAMRKHETYIKSILDRGEKAIDQAQMQFHSTGITRPTSSKLSSLINCEDVGTLVTMPRPVLSATSRVDSVLAHYKHALFTAAANTRDAYVRMREISRRLHHIPVIDRTGRSLTIAVLGVPNVGKSSLITMMSSGTPDVQNYSFTTRGLIVGHFDVTEYAQNEQNEIAALKREFADVKSSDFSQLDRPEETKYENDDAEWKASEAERRRRKIMGELQEHEAHQSGTSRNRRLSFAEQASMNTTSSSRRVQMIDTPGILFRPDSQRKRIELLTLTSLHYLSVDCVLFVIDLSQSCGYSIQEQLHVREEIRARYQNRLDQNEVKWIDCLSKSDLPSASFEVNQKFSSETEDEQEMAAFLQHKQKFELPAAVNQSDVDSLLALLPSERISVSVNQGESLSAFKFRLISELRTSMRKQKEADGIDGDAMTIEDEFKQAFAAYHTRR